MKDQINRLAILFVEREAIDTRIAVLLGGQSQTVLPGKPAAKRKKQSGKLSDELKDEIRQKHSEGLSKDILAKEYGVSTASIYNYTKTKPLSQRTKNKPVTIYTCVNGHEFKSKLLPGDVMCPTCHSKDCDMGTLNGPVKEDT